MFAPRGWMSRSLPREMYRLFSQSEYFDRKWYRAKMPPLDRWQDPLWHYIQTGGLRGLAPSAHFDSAYYLEKNDDVRVSRLNPLYHFLAHGKAERRLPLRSAQEMVHWVAPETAALRAFVTPQIGSPRVSLLLDSATPNETVEAFLQAASSIAQSSDASLRVLFRGIGPDPQTVNSALAAHGQDFLNAVEITPVPLTETYSDIPFYAGEIALATSWSSAEALKHAAKSDESWVLIPETNRITPRPTGLVGEGSTFPSTVRVVSNTTHVRQSMALESARWPSQAPEHSRPPTNLPATTNNWHLSILCDSARSPVAFMIAIRSVSDWLAKTTGEVTISLSPGTGEPFAFFDELLVHDPTDMHPAHCLLVMSSQTIGDDVLESLGFPSVIQVSPEAVRQDAPVSGSSHTVVEPETGEIVRAISSAYASGIRREVPL